MSARAYADTTNNLLTSYNPPEGFYDEFVDNSGLPREHWQPVVESFSKFSRGDIQRRHEQLQRIIRDNGIVYNVYSENHESTRPWTMDLLPFLMTFEEWNTLSDGLNQRAVLFNEIMRDLYGPQKLIKTGLLPSYLVLANPGFIHACHGWTNAVEFPIHLFASDLARSPDGSWWVLSDRLEAASGLGYALENRFISSRLFPSVMRQAGVQRMHEFISRLCASYEQRAPMNKDHPRIVLMTPGPANETYFEQSFLARNLGYTLVEGADLAVRDNRLFLKTISGMKEVDVVIRRVDSHWIDPLELRNDSLLGVPGLLDVIRTGRVAMINNPGSGLLETAGLQAFLPSLCRHLLGEELRIPSVATWWCGQKKECDYVLENLENLVVKPTFRSYNTASVFGNTLGESSLDRLRRKITAHPEQWCAQEMVAQATTPVYAKNRLVSRHFLLRSFLIPSADKTAWNMLPGGLARIAADSNPISVSMQRGGQSKDIWVLGQEKSMEDKPVLIASLPVTPIRRGSFDLPSRQADNFFWLGRYLERTEGVTRVLRSILESLTDETENEWDLSMTPLFQFLLEEKVVKSFLTENSSRLDLTEAEKHLSLLIRDARNPESLVSNLTNLQRVMGLVKERLSSQTWRQLKHLTDLTQAASTQRSLLDEESFLILDDILGLLAGISGLAMENMTRGQNWLFLELGRRIDRAVFLAGLLEECLGRKTPYEEDVLRKMLVCADSSMTYRQRYLTQMSAETVLDLLILENTNPRSLIFQAEQIMRIIEKMPHNLLPAAPSPINQEALKVYSMIGLTQVNEVLAVSRFSRRTKIQSWCNQLKDHLYALSMKIEQQYFAHTSRNTDPRPKSILG